MKLKGRENPEMSQFVASAHFLIVNTVIKANSKLPALYQREWIRRRCAQWVSKRNTEALELMEQSPRKGVSTV